MDLKNIALLSAAQTGNVESLRTILSATRDVSAALLFSDIGNTGIWSQITETLNDDSKMHSGDRPLHRACRYGQIVAVRVLIGEFSASLDQANNRGETAASIAAQKGYLDILKFILQRRPDLVNAGDERGRTPLMCAAGKGQLQTVEWLMRHGGDINAKSSVDYHEMLAIHLAAWGGHKQVVQRLLYENPDLLEAKTMHNDTPLNWAAYGGQLAMVEMLVAERRANMENKGFRGRTPLLEAAARGHLQIVQWLVDHNAFIEARSSSEDLESMAIHLASSSGYKDVVTFLIAREKRLLEVKDANNDTPINRAAGAGQLAIVKVFTARKKVSMEQRGLKGRTALLQATIEGHSQVVEWLVSQGADILAKSIDADESMAIHLAAALGHLEIVQCLLNKQPKLLRISNKSGETAFIRAVSCGHLPIVEYLVVEKKVSIKYRDKAGFTPLFYAVEKDHLHVVKWLVENGANVGVRDLSNQDSLLHVAARQRNGGGFEVASFLLAEKPGLVDARNVKGETPLNCAIKAGNSDIAKLLSQLNESNE